MQTQGLSKSLKLQTDAIACHSRSRPRTHFCIRAGESKGFGSTKTNEGNTKPAGKMSKHGTLASRAGQPSKKQIKQQQEMMSKLAQQKQQPDTPPEVEEEIQEVPQVVTDRMLKRIILCTGVPVFTGFLLYPLFYYLKVAKGIDLPLGAVYVTQSLTFGVGLLGITYGVMSTSWDPRREGSLLGITEFKANLPITMDRFRRR